ncbi:MAG: HAD family hydrolase [Chloroflexi bacterium]|nr:HAD family hydrolase [Chloroflexota bacterium]
MSAGVQAVIFDWGGTLATYARIEAADMWALAARHIAEHHADLDEEQVRQRLGAVEEAFWARTASDQRSGTLADIIADAARELGVDVAEAVLEEAAVRHLDSWTPHIVHDPEAEATLAALRDRGIAVCLLSNTHCPRAFHERFLERDHLASLIDARVYTSELPHMKPHPLAFRAALDALGGPQPARTVFVGDRPFDDVHGAQSAGMRAVLRPNPDVPPYDVQPDAVIQRLPELLPLLDRWR